MMSPEANRAIEKGREEIARIMQGRTIDQLHSGEIKKIMQIKKNMERFG